MQAKLSCCTHVRLGVSIRCRGWRPGYPAIQFRSSPPLRFCGVDSTHTPEPWNAASKHEIRSLEGAITHLNASLTSHARFCFGPVASAQGTTLSDRWKDCLEGTRPLRSHLFWASLLSLTAVWRVYGQRYTKTQKNTSVSFTEEWSGRFDFRRNAKSFNMIALSSWNLSGALSADGWLCLS